MPVMVAVGTWTHLLRGHRCAFHDGSDHFDLPERQRVVHFNIRALRVGGKSPIIQI